MRPPTPPQMDVQNPFRFNFIRTCRAVRDLDDFQPAVVLASPGFLNSGPSRQLFDRWVLGGWAHGLGLGFWLVKP